MALGKIFNRYKQFVKHIQDRNQDYGSGYSDETGTYGTEGDLMEGNPEYYADVEDMYPGSFRPGGLAPERYRPDWENDPIMMGGEAQFEEQPSQITHIPFAPIDMLRTGFPYKRGDAGKDDSI
jgi:hypothetical protein